MDRVLSVVERRVTPAQIEGDIQLQRIVACWWHISRSAFQPITYHGKMRREDVEALEELRLARQTQHVAIGVPVDPRSLC